ncbi:hypothetical protein D088_930140 [Salmonella enterica subsp. houtenae serovar 16:z4,z32:-- str. RKS3027]|nr:hypothetical protein D088_930140 [Salmonella enterica subsp. houtenae serovar 16:z4,z32:-- str. RKS3027]
MLQALVLRHSMEARRAETVYRLRSRQPARTPAVKTGAGRKQKMGDKNGLHTAKEMADNYPA